MEKRKIKSYNRVRNCRRALVSSACHAPFVNMTFTTEGNVVACCRSQSLVLGNISTSSLDDIWQGRPVREMRSRLRRYDFPRACGTCRIALESGDYWNVVALDYDGYWVVRPRPRWPRQMEFYFSNVCNFQCIMCKGSLSSRVRAQRELLPPLPRVYGEAFFGQLAAYLPHLRKATFIGGEPFLMPETFRVFQMMSAMNLTRTPLHVITNGSVLDDRVREYLTRLAIHPIVSFDGARRETFESIRQGACFQTVVDNVKEYVARARARGTTVTLAICLMRQNWRELADILLLAERLGCHSQIGIAFEPDFCTLYSLPDDELREVVDTLHRQEKSLLPRLRRNAHTWRKAVENLRRTLAARHTADYRRHAVYIRSGSRDEADFGPLNRAWELVRRGDLRQALAQLDSLPSDGPDMYFVLTARGHIQRRLKNHTPARECLERATQLAPRRPEAYLEKAWLAVEEEAWDQGLAELDRIPETHLDRYDILVLYGLIHRRRGDFAAAETALNAAVRLHEDRVAAYLERAWLNLDGGHLGAGVTDAEHALTLDSGAEQQASLYDALGFLYLKMNHPDRAATCFQKFVDLQPHNPRAHLHLAWAHRDGGNHPAARASAEEARRLDPADGEAVATVAALMNGVMNGVGPGKNVEI